MCAFAQQLFVCKLCYNQLCVQPVYRCLSKSSLIEVPMSHKTSGYSSISSLSHFPGAYHVQIPSLYLTPTENHLLLMFSPRNVLHTDRDSSFAATSLCFTASLLYSFYTSAELSAKAGHLLRQLH